MQIMNVQQCRFQSEEDLCEDYTVCSLLIFFLCETKNIFLCLQEKWKLILLVKSCRRRSPAMILRPRYPNVCGEKSKQKLVICTRAGNEGSRRFPNHGEGSYQILVNPKGQAVWLAQNLKACLFQYIFKGHGRGLLYDCETCAKVW